VARKRRNTKKRKGHYHTGLYTSTKTGQVCKYRSGWEESYMQWLDVNDDVRAWAYESVVIPYVSNVRTGKLRKYHPDFLVEHVDGSQELVEVKPSKRVHQAKVAKKLVAAGDWSRAHGVTFSVVTETELRALGLLK
jgi:hypothetical protein